MRELVNAIVPDRLKPMVDSVVPRQMMPKVAHFRNLAGFGATVGVFAVFMIQDPFFEWTAGLVSPPPAAED